MARASRAPSSATGSPAARSATARTTCAPRARSARPRTPPASSRASAAPARWATSASPKRASRSSRSTPPTTCCSCAARSPDRATASWRSAPMADAPILGGSKKVALDDVAFGARVNGPLVHESVRAELNARRQGTSSTKTRGNVRGGGAKPWRQKGTGRARAGSSRSPIWTGGGAVFPPQPHHYTFDVHSKHRPAPLRIALALHAGRGSLAVVDSAPFDTPSTKAAAALVSDWGQPKGVLVVLTEEQANVALSFRNLDRV